ncbi:MAG: hypothetical protein VKI83_03830 [Synechococcaceae cyanobacterium]|nr:hypothetical protein [Synechococcaceae cyanobacterium]
MTASSQPSQAPPVVNRCAVMVSPRAPMQAWCRPFRSREEIEALVTEPSLYLLPTFDDAPAAMALLQRHWRVIFETELDLWCRDSALWPSERSLEQFEAWFELRLFPLVQDLGGGEEEEVLGHYPPEPRAGAAPA